MLRKWLPWVLKFALSGFIIWFVLRGVDLGAAWERGRSVVPAMFGLALLLCLFQNLIGALRWRVALKALGPAPSFLNAFLMLYMSMFFSLVLPGAVGGDAVRMWTARKSGLTLVHAVNSVILERVATLLGLFFLVTLTEPLLFSRIGDNPAVYVFPVLAVLGVLGVGVLMVLDQLPGRLHRWRLVRAMGYVAGDTRRLFLSPRSSVAVLVFAVLGHVNLSLVVYVLALGLGMGVTFVDCVVLVPPVILIMTIPISIAGWGVREGAMVTAFGFIGIPPEQALALSVLFGLTMTLGTLPGGLIWFFVRGLNGPATVAPEGASLHNGAARPEAWHGDRKG
ncbi:MAG: flippase-like domain-containing protein [Alphaproteobacteria bacterium]|nr:flippase-like domain-containing protein [Alphaproteobacteria bacterium]MBF0129048.1 flippase-like domain-containing protein [Alphaproteobacteria bacterium]